MNIFKKNKNKRSRNSQRAEMWRAGHGILNRALFVMLLAFGLYYVAGINDLSVKGFILKDLKGQVEQLKGKHRDYSNRVTRLESCESLEQRAASLELVAVDKVEYVTTSDGAVAKK